MNDILLVIQYLFNWKFLFALFCLLTIGLTLPQEYTKPFRSVKFNVWLFLIIAIASSIGTFIPQNKSAEAALAKFGPFWSKIFDSLGFMDIYHTWWFSSLLALMAFDVVVCKLRKLPRLYLGPLKEELSQDITIETLLSKSKFKDQFRSTASSMQTAEQVRRWLKARKLNYSESVVTLKQQDLSTVLFMAGKHRFQRWGDFILHISIVIILAGNLMGAMFGFEEILPIPEGGSVKMTNRPFEVFLKKFDIDYYKTTGAPSLYASDLLVRQNDKVIAEKRIIVNEPLDIDRVRFYQASWGMTYDFKSAMFRIAGLDLVLPPKEIIPVPGTPLSIRANQFLPSFTLDPDGRATTMNFEGQNPALQIDFLEKGKVQVQLWILKNHPDVVYRIKDDKLTRTAPPPFQLIDVEPILFSGVQVGYDPGAPLFWFGAVILLFGLCIHFYMHQRRLRILIIPKGPQTEVVVGGWNSLTPEDFSQEFRNWVTDIRRSVEHGGV